MSDISYQGQTCPARDCVVYVESDVNRWQIQAKIIDVFAFIFHRRGNFLRYYMIHIFPLWKEISRD
jgi:hypothetical protein